MIGHSHVVAYLGFHFGGVQHIFRKVGVFAWREVPCRAWRSHTFARGVREHTPPRIFLKYCNFTTFSLYSFRIFCPPPHYATVRPCVILLYLNRRLFFFGGGHMSGGANIGGGANVGIPLFIKIGPGAE